jgi:hypothetical protein
MIMARKSDSGEVARKQNTQSPADLDDGELAAEKRGTTLLLLSASNKNWIESMRLILYELSVRIAETSQIFVSTSHARAAVEIMRGPGKPSCSQRR